MKTLRITLIGLLIAGISLFAGSAKAADKSVTLSCVTFSWPETIYRPLSGGRVVFNLSYKNNCTYEVLQAKYDLVDEFGSSISTYDIVGLKAGVTANQNQSWSASDLSKGTEPFNLKFSVQHFATFGISNPAPVSIPFKFTERTTASPSPAPTVTVTASPSPAPTVTVTASPSPAPTVTVTATPAPAPTVTVTATPAPAPTVTVTATPTIDGVDVALLNTKITVINNQLKTLNAKVKRICAIKPKPKGC